MNVMNVIRMLGRQNFFFHFRCLHLTLAEIALITEVFAVPNVMYDGSCACWDMMDSGGTWTEVDEEGRILKDRDGG